LFWGNGKFYWESETLYPFSRGGRVSYGVKFRDTRKHWNNPKIIAV